MTSIIVAITRAPRPRVIVEDGPSRSTFRSAVGNAGDQVRTPTGGAELVDYVACLIGPDGETRWAGMPLFTNEQLDARDGLPTICRRKSAA